jgi:hypothetical protein
MTRGVGRGTVENSAKNACHSGGARPRNDRGRRLAIDLLEGAKLARLRLHALEPMAEDLDHA